MYFRPKALSLSGLPPAAQCVGSFDPTDARRCCTLIASRSRRSGFWRKLFFFLYIVRVWLRCRSVTRVTSARPSGRTEHTKQSSGARKFEISKLKVPLLPTRCRVHDFKTRALALRTSFSTTDGSPQSPAKFKINSEQAIPDFENVTKTSEQKLLDRGGPFRGKLQR